MTRYRLIYCIAFSLVSCTALTAQDWTQWGGPDRDFNVPADRLPSEIKLTQIWRRNLGAGYSAILAEGDRLYTMYRKNDKEFIVCMNASDGTTIWEKDYDAPMKKDATTEYGRGPNSTPIITGESIIAIGFNGDLNCLDKNNGQIRWNTNIVSELSGTNVDLGYSQSPIVYEGKLILPVGGKDKGIAALNLKDGSVAWSAQDFKNSYSTPMLNSVDGLDQMIFVMTDEVVSINPKNGELYWTFPLKNQWSTHAFVPVWDPKSETLFVSSFRQSHGLGFKREGDKISVQAKWSIPKTGIGFANAVVIDGIVVGTTGGSSSPLVTGIDVTNGKILWRERGFRTSNYLAIGERIILLDENGMLAIAKPTQNSFNVIQKQKVLNAPKAWTVPTMVGNKLFIRDQKEIAQFVIE